MLEILISFKITSTEQAGKSLKFTNWWTNKINRVIVKIQLKMCEIYSVFLFISCKNNIFAFNYAIFPQLLTMWFLKFLLGIQGCLYFSYQIKSLCRKELDTLVQTVHFCFKIQDGVEIVGESKTTSYKKVVLHLLGWVR